VVNAGLNLVLVHGVGLGIAGSGIGTATTQLLMALAVGAVVVRGARAGGAPLRPDAAGIRAAARSGVALLVRTLALRAAILVTTYAAATAGPAQLAAHQVVTNLWGLLALALDAVAIAAQALTATALGAGDVPVVRATTATMIRWGAGAGLVLGVLSGLAAPVLAPLFSDDPVVRSAIVAAALVAAVTQPIAGYVFVLDGVLIGAGDGTFLAVAGVVQTALYAPLALVVTHIGTPGTQRLVLLWVAFSGGWLLLRALCLGLRQRSDAWLVTGAVRPRGR
jgi:putative MATE family efflux protein